MMRTYQVTLCVEVPDTVLHPKHWNWDTLINPEDTAPGSRTPVTLVGAFPLEEGKA